MVHKDINHETLLEQYVADGQSVGAVSSYTFSKLTTGRTIRAEFEPIPFTVTFVDGFGRPVQVKKDGVVTSASEGSVSDAQNVMIVSGRNVYDAFGRVAKAYYPVTEELGKRTDFNKAFDGVSPTVTVYDVLDRATEVTLPDESKTLTAYTTDAGSRALVTTCLLYTSPSPRD